MGDYVLSLSSSVTTDEGVLKYREEVICLPRNKQYFPYACGGYYSNEVAWSIYRGTNKDDMKSQVAVGSAKEVCSEELRGLYGSFDTDGTQAHTNEGATPSLASQHNDVLNDVGVSHFGLSSISTSFYNSASSADRAVREILSRVRQVLGNDELAELNVAEMERHAKAGAERKQYRQLQVMTPSYPYHCQIHTQLSLSVDFILYIYFSLFTFVFYFHKHINRPIQKAKLMCRWLVGNSPRP